MRSDLDSVLRPDDCLELSEDVLFCREASVGLLNAGLLRIDGSGRSGGSSNGLTSYNVMLAKLKCIVMVRDTKLREQIPSHLTRC